MSPFWLRCVEVRAETPSIKTFVLSPDDGGKLDFLPGQALTLALPVEGERLFRTFSISAGPGDISLTVKAQADGRATRWLHDQLRPGTLIEVTGPVGRFTLDQASDRPIALVSAGSGASPLMAMLRWLAVHRPAQDVAWLHAARRPDEVLFATELATLQRAMPGLTVTVMVSRPEPGWFGLRGRLGRRLAAAAIPDFGRRDTYCCGPVGFMTEARLIHAAEGGARERFRIEHFHPVEAAPEPTGTAPSGEFTITLGERRFSAGSHETVLLAATRQQVVIPCGCAGGMCGTCRVRMVAGAVEMRHQGGLSAEDEAAGYILACSSRPRSDVTIALEG